MFPRSGFKGGLRTLCVCGEATWRSPRLRSRTTPRARGRARAYHHRHRGRSCAGEREATCRLAFTSGRVTRDDDNGSRHGRYSAAGVSIGTERASITTTTTKRGHGTGHLGRVCAMQAHPSRRCEIAWISRTARTSRAPDPDRRSSACQLSKPTAPALTVSPLKSTERQQRSGRTPTPCTYIQAWYSAIGGNRSGTRHGGPRTYAAIGPRDT